MHLDQTEVDNEIDSLEKLMDQEINDNKSIKDPVYNVPVKIPV